MLILPSDPNGLEAVLLRLALCHELSKLQCIPSHPMWIHRLDVGSKFSEAGQRPAATTMPGASEEGHGQWHAGAGRAQGSVSPMESEGSKTETVKGALRERLQFSPGMLDRASIWPWEVLRTWHRIHFSGRGFVRHSWSVSSWKSEFPCDLLQMFSYQE